MTFEQMDSLLHGTYLGGRSDATSALRLLFLNEAARELATSFFFDELETLETTLVTEEGTASYAMQGSDYHIETMKIITEDFERPIGYVDWNTYNARLYTANNTGVPEEYTVHAGLIYLGPIPDGEYTIQTTGVRLPEALTGTNEPSLPADWHMIQVMKAAADFMFAKGETTRAMTIKNEYLSKISSRQEKRTLRRLQEKGQVIVQRVKPRGYNG